MKAFFPIGRHVCMHMEVHVCIHGAHVRTRGDMCVNKLPAICSTENPKPADV